MKFTISSQIIDAGLLRADLDDQAAGACVVFEGRVRNHNEGRAVERLEYEAHRPIAEAEGLRILEEARDRFGCTRALAVHREGLLELGEIAVWIGVLAPHRDAAFAACRYIIDELKSRLPIWKKEFYRDRTSQWIGADGEPRVNNLLRDHS